MAEIGDSVYQFLCIIIQNSLWTNHLMILFCVLHCFVFYIDIQKQMRQRSLVQEFISNQFLVHGKAIQVGFKVLITSAEPLRVYIQTESTHRCASKPFYPINVNDNGTYLTDGIDGVGSIAMYKVKLTGPLL